MKQYSPSKGMSLVEIMVATAIFAVFTLVVANMVITSSRSYARGRALQDIKRDVTTALKIISEDISRGIIIPNKGGTGVRVPSAVILPNPYGVNTTVFRDEGNGISKNRIIMILPNKDQQAQDMTNLTDTADPSVRFVEYVILNTEPTKLYRRIYKIGDTSNGYGGYELVLGQWIAKDAYFISSNMISSSIVIELPGPKDSMSLECKRPKLPSKNMSYGVTYDRSLYSIYYSIKQDLNDKKPPITYSESTTVCSKVR